MCAGMEGREMMRVFAKYYPGRSVDESDSEVLDALSMTEYLEYYVCDGVLCARAGPIGRLFKNPVRFRSLRCSLRYDRQPTIRGTILGCDEPSLEGAVRRKSRNHETIARESLAKAESYGLYFDSFISLYSDRFDPEWLENKKREMEPRIGKARVAYSTIYKERRNEYEHTTIGIVMIALGVSVIATIANLIASFL